MSTIQRYSLELDGGYGGESHMAKDKHGDWVEWDEVQKLEAHITKLEKLLSIHGWMREDENSPKICSDCGDLWEGEHYHACQLADVLGLEKRPAKLGTNLGNSAQ